VPGLVGADITTMATRYRATDEVTEPPTAADTVME
jgi:hypothetical protein